MEEEEVRLCDFSECVGGRVGNGVRSKGESGSHKESGVGGYISRKELPETA